MDKSCTALSQAYGRLEHPDLPPKSTRHRIALEVSFYGVFSGSHLSTRLWSALCKPEFVHVTLGVGGVVIWDTGSWFDYAAHRQGRQPKEVVTLPNLLATPYEVTWAAQASEGWRTSKVSTCARLLTGRPKVPRNCTTSVCTILTRLGRPVYAVTPDQLYRKLHESFRHHQGSDQDFREAIHALRQRGVLGVAARGDDP